MQNLVRKIDTFNNSIGHAAAWCAIALVVVQFVVVVLRYVFGIGLIMMQEGVVYLHATLFMMGAAHTLCQDGHVRVDIFYREATPQTKALVDLFGSLVFLLPVCCVIFWFAWPYVSQSWSVFEGSRETSGIQAVFLLKTLILVFAVLMALQGISMMLRSVMFLRGREA
ncbi:MAG: TRAP transporter small permease subunit [Rhodospirillales bacterium]|nr:TRAP transporter small permease subunit [Rhodospirillales bacterium]